MFSQTATDLAYYFQCKLIKDKTAISDILFRLGSVEKGWEVSKQN